MKMMKRFLLSTILLMAMSVAVHAQEGTTESNTTNYANGEEVVDGLWPWAEGTITFKGDDLDEVEGLTLDAYDEIETDNIVRALLLGHIMHVTGFNHDTTLIDGRYVSQIEYEFKVDLWYD